MATWNLADTGILSISYSAPVRVRNRHKDVSPATSSRLLLRTPTDRPKVCLKKTELRDPGGGDVHPMGKALWLAPQNTSGVAGKGRVTEMWFGVPQT